MKVSVVVPVYNKAAHVRAALDSILNGTWRELELIAVDDHSTDGSLAELRSINDPRLRIIALPQNGGPAVAANAGLDAARGEYVARMDADDISVPERLALQVAYMDAHPGVGASSGHLRLFGDSTGEWRMPLTTEACRAHILFGPPITQGCCILRRSVLERHGIRYRPDAPRVGEDWLLWARLLQVTDFGNVDQVLLHYRRDEGNISRTSVHAQYLRLLQQVFASFELPLTETQADVHAMAMRRWVSPPNAARVVEFRRWLDRLLRLNEAKGLFPRAAFAAEVSHVWQRLFHHLPPLGFAPAWAHLRQGGPGTAAHALYWLKQATNRATGRQRK